MVKLQKNTVTVETEVEINVIDLIPECDPEDVLGALEVDDIISYVQDNIGDAISNRELIHRFYKGVFDLAGLLKELSKDKAAILTLSEILK